jgi:hypothetical protein
LASNALAIRIIFPSVRVIQVSFNLTGLPASLGKQKKPRNSRGKERMETSCNEFSFKVSINLQILTF